MFQSICRMNCYTLNGLIALTETLDILLLTAYICQNLFTAESYAKLAVRCWHIISEMKVSYILHHWSIQLILAYSWARPAIHEAGKGIGGMFLFLLILHFHSCSFSFPVPLSLLSVPSLFSPSLWETTQNDPQGLTCH